MEKDNFTLLAIVAIFAIAGIVIMVLTFNNSVRPEPEIIVTKPAKVEIMDLVVTEEATKNYSMETVLLGKNETIQKIPDLSYKITLVDVTSDSQSCVFDVNGEIIVVDKGKERKINGLRIGVLDVKSVHSIQPGADVCECYIR
ncbi:hypothetical protein ACFL0W_04155 [Nanoarchaeota archaeon]